MSGITRSVRSATLFGYAELAQSVGLPASTMLRRVGLSRHMLEDPERPVSLKAVSELLEQSAIASSCEDFGLRMAARRRLSHLGPISVVLREEPTALAALQTLTRYLKLINASLTLRIELFSDIVVISEDILSHDATPKRQSIEMAVAVVYRTLQELMGPQWRAQEVCFSHRAPRALAQHRAMLGPRLRFNADFNGVVCKRAELEAQLPGRDAQLAHYAKLSFDKALAQTGTQVGESVRQIVAALLPLGRCTADQVAQRMGLNRRTVHRQLARDGETFTSALQAVRKEYAMRQLRDSDRPLNELAALLGFSGASAFAHWFRTQFGMSAQAWKAQTVAQTQAKTAHS
jgi:AraC-like DNA-binding protein